MEIHFFQIYPQIFSALSLKEKFHQSYAKSSCGASKWSKKQRQTKAISELTTWCIPSAISCFTEAKVTLLSPFPSLFPFHSHSLSLYLWVRCLTWKVAWKITTVLNIGSACKILPRQFITIGTYGFILCVLFVCMCVWTPRSHGSQPVSTLCVVGVGVLCV